MMAPTKNAEKTAFSCHCISIVGCTRNDTDTPRNATKPVKLNREKHPSDAEHRSYVTKNTCSCLN